LKEELNKEFSAKTLQRFLKTLVGQAGDVAEVEQDVLMKSV
jgi:hypothetical protein